MFPTVGFTGVRRRTVFIIRTDLREATIRILFASIDAKLITLTGRVHAGTTFATVSTRRRKTTPLDAIPFLIASRWNALCVMAIMVFWTRHIATPWKYSAYIACYAALFCVQTISISIAPWSTKTAITLT